MNTTNDHTILLYNSQKDQSLLLWWNIDTEDAVNYIIDINNLFYDMYDIPIPLDTWRYILNKLFNAIDLTSIMPVLTKQYQTDIANLLIQNQNLSAPTLQKNLNVEGDQTEYTLVTTILVDRLTNTIQNDDAIQLSKTQTRWLLNVFTGKIKVNDSANNQRK